MYIKSSLSFFGEIFKKKEKKEVFFQVFSHQKKGKKNCFKSPDSYIGFHCISRNILEE